MGYKCRLEVGLKDQVFKIHFLDQKVAKKKSKYKCAAKLRTLAMPLSWIYLNKKEVKF